MKKLAGISTVNFIMSCVVVIYHCYLTRSPSSMIDAAASDYLTQFINQLLTVAMSYFFFTTAFLMFRNLTIKNYGEKIKKRVFSLLIPYIFWQIVFIIVLLIAGRGFSPVDCVKSVFLFADFPPDGPLWYLYTVFILSLISPLLLLLFKKKTPGFVILVILLFLIYGLTRYGKLYSVTHYGMVINVFFYLFPYLLGAFYGMHYPNLDDYRGLRYAGALLFIGFITSFGPLSGFGLRIISTTVPIFILCFFPKRLSKERKIYRISFIMFATHQPVYELYSGLLYNLLIKANLSSTALNVLSRIIALAVSMALASIINFTLEKVFPKGLKFISGGRL